MILSLRTKILMCALIPPVLMLVVVAVVTLRLYEDATRDVVTQRDTELARISSARLAENLRRYNKLLQGIAAGEDVQSMEPGRLSSALEEAGGRLDMFDAGVVLYNSAGVALSSWPSVPEGEGTHFTVTPKFNEARESRRPVYSNIFRDEITGDDVILIGAPVFRSDGEFNGMVAGMATLHRSPLGSAYAEVLELRAGHTGYAYLVDGKGRAIYHRYHSLVGTSLADATPVAQVVLGKTGAVFEEDTTGKTIVSGFAPVPGTDWGVVTHEHWDVIAGPIRGYNTLLLGLLAMAGLCSSLLVIFVITRSLRPIRELTVGVQRIAEGKYGHSIVARSDDEVGRLSRAFNDMAARLKANFQKLDHLNTVLRAIRNVNQLITQEKDRDKLLQGACDNLIETRGYYSSWIALFDDSGGFLAHAEAGLGEDFMPMVDLLKQGKLTECGAKALSQPEIVVNEDPASDCAGCPLADKYAGRSAATVRLEYEGKVYGLMSTSVPRDLATDEEELGLFHEVAVDIAFALNNLELEEERRRAEEKIKEYSENLEDMVEQRTSELEATQEAMVNLVEDLNDSKDELKKKALELEEMNIRIQEATDAKSQFLANMSHELRTPLNAIIGFSEILEDQTFGELNEKQTRYINNVLVSGRHLLQLINDILDLSKVEAGKLGLELSRVNIKGLLENSLIMIKEKAMKHGLKLDSHISQGIMDLEILADERKLKQIMFNILSNAAKFTPDGGSITLAARLGTGYPVLESEISDSRNSTQYPIPDTDRNFIEISVADTGIGIKPEDQERVFGEFEQLDSTYARQQEGTGLGLALTRRLVELHGGRIWVESEGEGKGSTFTFLMPIKAEERKIEIPTEPEEPLPSRPDVDDSRPLVLVVEDDHQASELISQYLSEADYAVACAFDGEQAIQMARELRPYAITLDIILPKKDGWEVLADLKSFPETKDIPVVIVSIVENRPFGLNLGAIEYFVKPVNKEQLIEAVRKAGAVLGKEKITVLVVDDEPKTVELLTDMLQAEGFRVLQAYGGQQGIDIALEKHPDLIVLDLMMPEVNGFDVVEQLRAHSEAMGIPILIFTAKDLTEEDRQRLNSHVQAIASKSGSGKEDLLRALESLVKRKLNR